MTSPPRTFYALKSWRDIADFEVAGADHDFVMLVFRRLPERICDFASTVYELCPDSASQGPGIDPKWNNPEKIALATQLCPSVTAKSRDMPEEVLSMMGEDFQELLIADMQKDVRLLALKLRETRELFLWWD